MPCFLSAGAPQWTAALAGAAHDFYALPCFTALDASWSGGEAVAYYDEEGGLLIPLVRRRLPHEVLEASSPYGYPGLVTTGSPASVSTLIGRYLTAGQQAGLVTSFVRLHPLLNADVVAALDGLPGATAIDHGPTVLVSLDEDEETWMSGLPKGLRRDIRMLQRDGYTVQFDGPGALGAFTECYRASMDRLDAEDSYLFDEAYLERLTDCLGTNMTVCVVSAPEGEAACAGLFTCVKGIAQYHLSGTNPEYFAKGPNKLMLAEARNWVRGKGAQAFHLGGGVGARTDGLFKFKERFGYRLARFSTLRLIHDQDRYAALHRAWLQEHDLPQVPDPDFFPVYRQGV